MFLTVYGILGGVFGELIALSKSNTDGSEPVTARYLVINTRTYRYFQVPDINNLERPKRGRLIIIDLETRTHFFKGQWLPLKKDPHLKNGLRVA